MKHGAATAVRTPNRFRRLGERWTLEEDELISETPTEDLSVLAERLGRTRESLRQRRQQLRRTQRA